MKLDKKHKPWILLGIVLIVAYLIGQNGRNSAGDIVGMGTCSGTWKTIEPTTIAGYLTLLNTNPLILGGTNKCVTVTGAQLALAALSSSVPVDTSKIVPEQNLIVCADATDTYSFIVLPMAISTTPTTCPEHLQPLSSTYYHISVADRVVYTDNGNPASYAWCSADGKFGIMQNMGSMVVDQYFQNTVSCQPATTQNTTTASGGSNMLYVVIAVVAVILLMVLIGSR